MEITESKVKCQYVCWVYGNHSGHVVCWVDGQG